MEVGRSPRLIYILVGCIVTGHELEKQRANPSVGL